VNWWYDRDVQKSVVKTCFWLCSSTIEVLIAAGSELNTVVIFASFIPHGQQSRDDYHSDRALSSSDSEIFPFQVICLVLDKQLGQQTVSNNFSQPDMSELIIEYRVGSVTKIKSVGVSKLQYSASDIDVHNEQSFYLGVTLGREHPVTRLSIYIVW
jgi:hypothetical protein